MYVCIYVRMCMYAYIYVYTHIYIHIYVCVCMFVCVCVWGGGVLSTASRESNYNIYKYLFYYFSKLETVYLCPGKVGNVCLVKGNIYRSWQLCAL